MRKHNCVHNKQRIYIQHTQNSLGQGCVLCIAIAIHLSTTDGHHPILAKPGLLKRSRLAIFNFRLSIDYLIDWIGNGIELFFNCVPTIKTWNVYFAVKYVLTYHDRVGPVSWCGPTQKILPIFTRGVYNYLATAPEQLSNSKVETSNLFAAWVPSCASSAPHTRANRETFVTWLGEPIFWLRQEP